MSEELKATAEKYFEAYPKEDVLHITSDGQVFLAANHNDAKNHQLRLDASVPLTTIWRKEIGLQAAASQEEKESGDDIPDESFTKDAIINWLGDRNVAADMKESKKELLDKVLAFIQEEESEPEND